MRGVRATCMNPKQRAAIEPAQRQSKERAFKYDTERALANLLPNLVVAANDTIVGRAGLRRVGGCYYVWS